MWFGAAVVVVAEFVPPIEIPDVGPVDAPSIMPAPAPVESFIGQVENKWSAWWDFSVDKFGSLWSGLFDGANAAISDVKDMVTTALSWEHTLWSSFHTLQYLFTVSVWDTINSTVDTLQSFVIGSIASLGVDVLNIETWLGEVIAPEIAGIEGDLRGWETWTITAIGQVIDGLQGWAIDHIYNPLDADIRNVETWVEARVDSAIDTLRGDIAEAVHNEALQRLAAIAGIAAAVSAIASWVDDCGEPMCQTLGPKTDLGKILKALSVATDLALFAELANLDEAQLQQLLSGVAGWGGRVVTAFDDTFIESGGRLRDVLSDVGL